MSANLYGAVTAWLARGVPAELSSAGFAQTDLDDLLGDPPPLAVETGLLCLELAVILGRQEMPGVDGLLTIPLPASHALEQDSPTLQDLLTQVWEYGAGIPVPGLYLIDPPHWRRYDAVEEYRRPLPNESGLPAGCAAYYRTWTSGGEYNRAIYVRTVDGS